MESPFLELRERRLRGVRVLLPCKAGLLALVLASCFVVANTALASFELDAMKACRRAISRQAGVYAKKRNQKLLRCVDKSIKCDLPQELEYEKVPDCPGVATDACVEMLDLSSADSGMSKAIAKFNEKVNLSCQFVGIAEMLDSTPGGGGLWYSNDPTCGAASDPNALFTCLLGRIDDKIDEMVGRNHPRAGLFLDNAGVGDHYPALPRPPKQTEVITAADGDLVSPGTIAIPAGTAVEFYADPNTVSCGGGPGEGKGLTIQVGIAGTACGDPNFLVMQERKIQEPYGPANVGVVGPFQTDIQYCIKLKDSTCTMKEDEEFGDITILP